MKLEKIFVAIIALIMLTPLAMFLIGFINTLLSAFGIESKLIVSAVVLVLAISIFRKISKDLGKRTPAIKALGEVMAERVRNGETGGKHVDFMTNRTTYDDCIKHDHKPGESAGGVFKETVNAVVWHWRDGRRGPEIIGAFCSKCEKELVPVAVAESWQADLRCNGCGKAYASFPGDAGGRARSFNQTKKMAAQAIAAKHKKSAK